MKPAPSDHLLGPGQSWTIIRADGWLTTEAGECTYRPEGILSGICREQAIVTKTYEGVISRIELLCEQHIGSFRWINEEGLVMQWWADPPWKYKKFTPKMPPRKR